MAAVLVRPGTAARLPDGGDAAAIAAVARGTDVVVNALNVSYERWRAAVPAFAAAALAAQRAAGALLTLPGNVYNFGAGMPPLLGPATPQRPTTRKGEIRAALERTLREACARDGLATAVVRAGDVCGGDGRGPAAQPTPTRRATRRSAARATVSSTASKSFGPP